MPEESKSPISRPPTGWEMGVNRAFKWTAVAFGWLTVILVLYIIWEIGSAAAPAMQKSGLSFVTGTTWDPNKGEEGEFGILPEIWGTLYSSFLALIIGTFFGVSVAIFLSEGFFADFVFRVLKLFNLQFHPFWGKMPSRFEGALKNIIELLAAIPSVVYGLWGLFVVIPLIRPMCNWLHTNLGWIPFFKTSLSGPGMLPASLVLAIMILPTISAISRDALVAVPPKLREASYGLGATRWETILAVILPTAAGGIFGSIILAFGRALGETMALAMLV
ncbi:MAG: ABC transporter permease subunit, partial [Pirellulales bacterium]|nr:ABC transporter permease subunit [Pirellulales bacterium]